jgi:hypothetical protein
VPSSGQNEITMMDWISLLLAFVFGLTVGIAFSSFLFESRIRFYREFIEQRLASINRLRLQGATTQRVHKSSFWRAILSRRTKSGEDAKPFQNK